MAANKTRSNSAKGKGRDKDLEAFDNNKTDKTNARAEAVEEVICKILNRYSLPYRERLFFEQMIDDIKGYKVDGFTIDDFSLIAKFNNSQKIADEARSILCHYFCQLCDIAEQEAKQKDEQEIIACYENFKRARGLLRLALPTNHYCGSIKELEEYKDYLGIKSDDESYLHTKDFKRMELNAYFFEFLKRANNYFQSEPSIIHYLKKDELKQREKDKFRDNLRDLADFSSTRALDDIKNSTLTQNIYDYVMKNFADFLADYKEPEINFRALIAK